MRVPAVQTYYRVPEVLEALRSIVATDLSAGEDVRQFEQAWARTLGVEACVTTSGARVALARALRALDLSPGSGVLMTPINPAEMVEAVRAAGMRPILVDMDPTTLFHDPQVVSRAAGPDVRAIVLTYLYGLVPATLDAILALASDRGLFVIEDISQAVGADIHGRPLGTLGDLGIVSFSSFKVVSSLGGGAVFGPAVRVERCRMTGPDAAPARGPLLALTAKVLAHQVLTGPVVYPSLVFPWVRALTRVAPGLLDRLQTGDIGRIFGRPREVRRSDVAPAVPIRYADFQARMAQRALRRLATTVEALLRHGERVASTPGLDSRLPARHPEGRSVFWRVPIRVHNATAAARFFAHRGIETSRNALPVCSDLPAFRDAVFEPPLRGTHCCDGHYLLIPNHADHDERTVTHVQSALAEFVAMDRFLGGPDD